VSSPLCVESVGCQTQLSLRCNYVLKNNYIFWLMMAIVRLPWEYLRTYCKLYCAHNVKISTCLFSKVWRGTNKTNQNQHDRRRGHPPGSHTLQGLHGNTAEHTNTQRTGKLFQTIHTPLQRNLPTHKTGLNIHLLIHTSLSPQAREFSRPRPLKPLPH